MVRTSLDQWKLWSSTYNMLPYLISEAWSSANIASWEQIWLNDRSPYSVLLESGKGGRYSFLGLHPEAVVTGKGHAAAIQWLDTLGRTLREEAREGAPLDVVKEWMQSYRAPRVEGAPPFLGGAAGYWSYDVARTLERLPELAVDDLSLPDYMFLQFNQLFIIDHVEQAVYFSVMQPLKGLPQEIDDLYKDAALKAEHMRDLWRSWTSHPNADKARRRRAEWNNESSSDRQLTNAAARPEMHADFPEDDFKDAVSRIQEYIRAGHTFQVNLSLRQHKQLRSDPAIIYEWLRIVNPSPYMALLRLPNFQVVSGSPELLVKLEQGRVSTRPIAGTRRRGRDAQEETRFQRELRENEKECAEHIMLVDLLRNDIGRIGRYGTVQVSELMAIEAYSHVMHLVSQIEGELDSNYDGFDVMKAVFPGGTITGAPKIRTMEIIEELEPFRRGLYTGSIGWIDYTGDMEFNIVIRTLIAHAGRAYVQAGAGIVIDSSPDREYKESLNKARALWKAVELSERENSL